MEAGGGKEKQKRKPSSIFRSYTCSQRFRANPTLPQRDELESFPDCVVGQQTSVAWQHFSKLDDSRVNSATFHSIFFFKFFFFLLWTILNTFIEFVKILLLFYGFLFCGHKEHGNLSSPRRDQTHNPYTGK